MEELNKREQNLKKLKYSAVENGNENQYRGFYARIDEINQAITTINKIEL